MPVRARRETRRQPTARASALTSLPTLFSIDNSAEREPHQQQQTATRHKRLLERVTREDEEKRESRKRLRQYKQRAAALSAVDVEEVGHVQGCAQGTENNTESSDSNMTFKAHAPYHMMQGEQRKLYVDADLMVQLDLGYGQWDDVPHEVDETQDHDIPSPNSLTLLGEQKKADIESLYRHMRALLT